MKWKILAIGKPSLSYARTGVDEYLKRMKRYAPVELVHHWKESGKEKNSANLLEASEGCFRIALDERGKALTTAVFEQSVKEWQMDGVKRVAVLIGGADGHTKELRLKSDLVLGLSTLTMQHELALLVFLEQIYRVHTMIKGEPYHR